MAVTFVVMGVAGVARSSALLEEPSQEPFAYAPQQALPVLDRRMMQGDVL